MLLDEKEGGIANLINLYPETNIVYDALPSRNLSNGIERVCLYDDIDLYDAMRSVSLNQKSTSLYIQIIILSTLRDTLRADSIFKGFWSAMSIPLSTVDMCDLSRIFEKLHPRYQHVGLDDMVDDAQGTFTRDNTQPKGSKFMVERIEKGKNVLASKSLSAAYTYAIQGIPSGLRSAIWDMCLQSDLVDDLATYVCY